MHHAGADAAGNVACTVQVRRGHITGQTIDGVIGNADGVFFIFVTDDRQYRPEDLFTGDVHVVGDVAEHRGLDVETGLQTLWTIRAAGDQLGAFLDPFLDQALDLLPLGFGCYWTDHGIAGIRIAGLDLGRNGVGDGGDFVHAVVGDQQTGRGVAGLPGVVHAGHHRVTNHLLEIDVIEQDVG